MNKNILLVLVSVFIVFSGCGNKEKPPSFDSISAEEMKEIINKEIPVGSSTDEIINFLRKKNISFTEQKESGSTKVGIFDKTRRGETNLEWITCAIQQDSLFYRNYKLMLEFYFDKNSKRLVRYEVFNNW